MNIDSFFGFESAEFKYDARKHLQIIFIMFCIYKKHMIPNKFGECIRHAQTLPEEDAAKYIEDNLLSPIEVQFIMDVRLWCNASDSDRIKILSTRTLEYGCKGPIGYNVNHNMRLLADMVIAKFLMQSADAYVINIINELIKQIGSTMKGVNVNQQLITAIQEVVEKVHEHDSFNIYSMRWEVWKFFQKTGLVIPLQF